MNIGIRSFTEVDADTDVAFIPDADGLDQAILRRVVDDNDDRLDDREWQYLVCLVDLALRDESAEALRVEALQRADNMLARGEQP